MLGQPAAAVLPWPGRRRFGSGELACMRPTAQRVWTDSLGASEGAHRWAISCRSRPAVIVNGLVYAISMGGLLVCNDVPRTPGVDRQVAARTPLYRRRMDVHHLRPAGDRAVNINDGRIAWITQLRHWEDPTSATLADLVWPSAGQ